MLCKNYYTHDWYFQSFSILAAVVGGFCSISLLSPEQTRFFLGIEYCARKFNAYFLAFTKHIIFLSLCSSTVLLSIWTFISKCANTQWSNPLLYVAFIQLVCISFFLYDYIKCCLSTLSEKLLISLYTLSFVMSGLSVVFCTYSLWLKLAFPWVDLGLQSRFPIHQWFIGLFVIGVLYFVIACYNWIMIRKHAFFKGNLISILLTSVLGILLLVFTVLVMKQEPQIANYVDDNCFALTQQVHQDTWTNQFQCQKYTLTQLGNSQDLTCDAQNTTFSVVVWDSPHDQYGWQGCINTEYNCCTALNQWLGFFLHIYYGLAFLLGAITILSLTIGVMTYFYQNQGPAACHELDECETKSFPSPVAISIFTVLHFLALLGIVSIALFISFVRVPIQATQTDPLQGKNALNLTSALPSGCVPVMFSSLPEHTVLSSTDGYFLMNTLNTDAPSIDSSRIELNNTQSITFVAFCPICWTRTSYYKIELPNQSSWSLVTIPGKPARLFKVHIQTTVSPYQITTLSHTLITEWLIHCPELQVQSTQIENNTQFEIILNTWVPQDQLQDNWLIVILTAEQHHEHKIPLLVQPGEVEVFFNPLQWADLPSSLFVTSSSSSSSSSNDDGKMKTSSMETLAIDCACDPLRPCLIGGVCGACPSGYFLSGASCVDVNECSTNNGGCHPQQVCSNTVGSWSCLPSCNAGYTFSSNENSCLDTNECAVNNGGCNTATTCINTLGSYSCSSTCLTGYTFNGITCSDVNECAVNNGGCDSIAQSCVNTPGSRVCSPCQCGFNQDSYTQCSDINECLSNSNACEQNCVNTIGSYTCNCNAGSTLDLNNLNCTDINECASNPCQNGASCLNQENQYTCNCVFGYAGTHCELVVNPCQSNPCQNSATCVPGNDLSSYTCACAAGYSGIVCETNVDECASNPCSAATTLQCVDGINSFTCICNSGYFGTLCNSYTSPCLSNPCGNGGTCSASNPVSFTCTCVSGFSGNLCQTNIDDCQINPCLNGGTCNDGLNSYTCSCPTNITGTFCETQVNPCNVNNGGCEQFCNWSGQPGVYTCSCASGYDLTDGTTCTDIYECADFYLCGAYYDYGVCINTPGSFLCSCHQPYYTLVGTDCVPQNPCSNSTTNNCDLLTTTCDYHGGIAYTCPCLPGYDQVDSYTCQDINECSATVSPCPTSPCYNYNGGYVCGTCPSGYTSQFDSLTNTYSCQDVDECSFNPSSCDLYSSTCTNTVGSYSCDCRYTFNNNNGTGCQSCDPCASNCLIGGYSCIRTGIDGCSSSCVCNAVNECATSNGGCDSLLRPCVDLTAGSFCSHCPIGYTEINPLTASYDKYNCYDIDECDVDFGDNNCGYGEVCTNTVGGFSCSGTCPLGYQLRVETLEVTGLLPIVPNYPVSTGVCSGTLYPNTTFYPHGNYNSTVKRYCDYIGLCQLYPTLCFDAQQCLSYLDEFDGETARFSCAPCPANYNTSFVLDTATNLQHQICTLLTCADVNPCDVAHGQVCISSPSGPVCGACPIGSFVNPANTNQCLNVNECDSPLTHTCEGNCIDLQFNGYTCGACPSGYENSFFPLLNWTQSNPMLELQICEDIDECILNSNACDLGVCVNTPGSSYCTSCPPGYSTLILSAQSQQCVDINECTNSSIALCDTVYQNCTNTIGSYSCTTCPPGFYNIVYTTTNNTERCFDVNECNTNQGGCSVFDRLCVNTVGSFVCAIDCPAGYQYDSTSDTCMDTNECASQNTNNCSTNSTCFNLIGSYWCGDACPLGYEGNSMAGCFDIDECTQGTHECSVQPATACFNYPGNYTCGPCPSGYSEMMYFNTQMCLDDNECLNTLNCDERRNCTNLDGSYLCGDCTDKTFNIDPVTCDELDECDFTTTILYQSQTIPLTGLCQSPELTCQTLIPGQSFCSGVCPSGYVLNTIQTTAYGSSTPFNISICADVDECSTENSGIYCDVLQTCTNLAGSYSCGPCPSGYTLNAQSLTCEDVDECLALTDNCASTYFQTCQNTVGSYVCNACISGYTNYVLGQACIDINECNVNNGGCSISPLQTCTNLPGSSTCGACPTGYTQSGTTSCVDIPECTIYAPCDSLTTCVEQPGSYYCSSCPAGYSGSGSTGCVDINECSSTLLNNCDALSSCTNTNGSYTCGNCTASGYTTIRLSDQDVICQDIDECISNPCHALTVCQNSLGSFACTACPSGYSGTGLTGCTDINECALGTVVCDSLTTCINVIGSPAFCTSCPTGYSGSGETGCINVNECFTNNGGCDTLQTCVDTIGSRTCSSCPAGYSTSLNGTTCTDNNECLSMCLSGGVCTNTVGSFTCTCNSGYIYNVVFSTCTDVDECLNSPCHALQNCTNSEGSYTCSNCTASGYTTVGNTCVDINECLDYSLPSQCATCTNFNGSFACVCNSGYVWNIVTHQCEDTDECTLYSNLCTTTTTSSTNLTCVNTLGSYICNGTCDSGYSFDSLTHQTCVDNDECTDTSYTLPSLCTSSNCVNLPGTFACNCSESNNISGYVWNADSLTCDDINECATLNGGCQIGYRNCINTNGSYSCGGCTSGYFTNGSLTTCSDVNECLMNHPHCDVCTNLEGAYACACSSGYTWNSFNLQCEDINECTLQNGGCDTTYFGCSNTDGSSSCTGSCPSGYQQVSNSTHSTCQDINECSLYMPCSSQRNCTNTAGSYTCSACPAGYTASSSTTCQDIDECDSTLNLNGCQTPLRTCINTVGSYQCSSCPAPVYQNNGTFNCSLTPIDPCTYCDPDYQLCTGSACTACPSGFTLTVNSTTHLERCIDVNECLSNNGGCTTYQTCTNSVGSFVCNGAPCPAGYTYSTLTLQCENINECVLNTDTCVDTSELCVDTIGSFVCQPNCITAIRPIYDPITRTCRKLDACLTNNGNCNSTSICSWNNVTEVATCNYCGNGYYNLNNNCMDINECSFGNGGCDTLTVCVNLNGTRECGSCPPGYVNSSPLTCVDVNECAVNNAGCDTLRVCFNQIGSYSCGPCPSGSFLFGSTCVDVNECAVNNGGCDTSPYRSCLNSPYLSWTCGPCPSGFFDFDGLQCNDVNECSSSSLNNCILSTQNCVNNNGSYTCVCKPGYVLQGGICVVIPSNNTNLCDLTPEQGGCDPLQKCKKDPKTKQYVCQECPKGYLTTGNGKVCVDINECLTNNGGCGTNKQCINTPGSKSCVLSCPPGHVRHSNSHHNDESCQDVNECRTNFGGCDNQSTRCVNSPGSYRCDCAQGFKNITNPTQQRMCQDINECAVNNGGCHSLTTCFNTPGLFRCGRCPIGYQGSGVSGCVPINPCAVNTYTCDPRCTCTPNSNSPYGRTCGRCPSGYFGHGDEACYPNSNTTLNNNANGGTISAYIELALTDDSVSVPDQVLVALLPFRHANIRCDSVNSQPDIVVITISGSQFLPVAQTNSGCSLCGSTTQFFRAVATWTELPWDCYRVRVLSPNRLSWHEGEYDGRSESRSEQRKLCVSTSSPTSLVQLTKRVYISDDSSVVFYHHWDVNSTQDFDMSLIIKRQDNSTVCRITRIQPYCLQISNSAQVLVGSGFNVIVLPNVLSTFKYIPVIQQLNPTYPGDLYQYLTIIPSQEISTLVYSTVSSVAGQKYWYPVCINQLNVLQTPSTFSSSLYPFMNTFC
jgi:hypothetical protein